MNPNEYNSPSTWRYGTQEMRHIWSETEKRRVWRQCWFAVAMNQWQYGCLVTGPSLDAMRSHIDHVDLEASLEQEQITKHDLVAELNVYMEQTGVRCIHLGLTSSDITETADAIRINRSLSLIRAAAADLMTALQWQDADLELRCLGRTHLQPAIPIDWGRRFVVWGSELRYLLGLMLDVSAKGFSGPVGDFATMEAAYILAGYEPRLARSLSRQVNEGACRELEVTPQVFTRQTPSRFSELHTFYALSSLAALLHQINQDLRLLAGLGELTTRKSQGQISSSSMPHKNNPITSENVCSLSRLVPQLTQVLWQDAASTMLERSLDDSANRRYVLPEVMLLTEHMLLQTARVVADSVPDKEAIKASLQTYLDEGHLQALVAHIDRDTAKLATSDRRSVALERLIWG